MVPDPKTAVAALVLAVIALSQSSRRSSSTAPDSDRGSIPVRHVYSTPSCHTGYV